MKKRRLLTVIVGVVTLGTVLGACSNGSDDGPKETARPAFVERIRLPGSDNGLPNPFAANPRGPGTINVNFVYDTLRFTLTNAGNGSEAGRVQEYQRRNCA